MSLNDQVKILLIDDHESDYFLIRDLLAKLPSKPYRLEFCVDPEEANQHLIDNKYDVYLVDYHLEKCDARKLILNSYSKGLDRAVVFLNVDKKEEQDIDLKELNFLSSGDLSSSMLDKVIGYSIEKNNLLRDLKIRDRKLNSLSSFQTLVASISKKILEGYGHDFDHEISCALNELGQFLNVGRCRIYETIEKGSLDTYCLWSYEKDSTATDALKKLDQDCYPVLLSEISKKGVCRIDQHHKSNLWETEIYEFIKSLGLETIVFIPLFFNGEWVGVLSLESKNDIDLDEVSESLIVWFSEMLGDVMERRQSKLTLGKARLEEAKATRVKSDFLSNMSHELKTPLNSILGMAEVLNQSGLVNDQIQCLDVLVRAANNLNHIFDDIFILSHLEDRPLEDREVVFNIETLINTKLLNYNKQQAKVELDVFIEEGLDREGRGDQEGLGAILDNLLSNALKFTDVGKVEISVSTHFDEENILEITVKDTGEEISIEDQVKVFDSFYQVKSSLNRAEVGSGLGLSIVKRILELQGCDIQLVSAPGEGSVFKFNFPFKSLQLN